MELKMELEFELMGLLGIGDMNAGDDAGYG